MYNAKTTVHLTLIYDTIIKKKQLFFILPAPSISYL